MKSLWQQIFQYALAALVAIGLFWIVYLLIGKGAPPENKDALLILLGVLAGGFTTIVSYFFGSSKGSSDKNDIFSKTNGKN